MKPKNYFVHLIIFAVFIVSYTLITYIQSTAHQGHTNLTSPLDHVAHVGQSIPMVNHTEHMVLATEESLELMQIEEIDESPGHVHQHEHLPVELASGENTLSTARDVIPNFAAHPTIRSKQSGGWFSPTTWDSNRVPTVNDVVKIEASHTVTYDNVSDVALAALGIEGTLTFSATANTRLKVGTILVYRNGKLHVGTQNNPINANRKAEIIIANRPLAVSTPDVHTKALDPLQFGTGLISFGEVLVHGELMNPTWVRVAQDMRAGDMTIKLAQAPTGWKAGDKLVIPDTRQTPLENKGSKDPERFIELQLEEVTIAKRIWQHNNLNRSA